MLTNPEVTIRLLTAKKEGEAEEKRLELLAVTRKAQKERENVVLFSCVVAETSEARDVADHIASEVCRRAEVLKGSTFAGDVTVESVRVERRKEKSSFREQIRFIRWGTTPPSRHGRCDTKHTSPPRQLKVTKGIRRNVQAHYALPHDERVRVNRIDDSSPTVARGVRPW